jgi:hypothetical protein
MKSNATITPLRIQRKLFSLTPHKLVAHPETFFLLPDFLYLHLDGTFLPTALRPSSNIIIIIIIIIHPPLVILEVQEAGAHVVIS